MKLEGHEKRIKRKQKSPDVIGRVESHGPFQIEELLQPEDLRNLRECFCALVERGRMYNASLMVSSCTLANGYRPDGLVSEEVLDAFYEYVQQDSSFNRGEVLQNILVAYPEHRERFSPIIESVLSTVILPEEGPPYAVGPEDFVLLQILKPELQHQIQLASEVMAEKEEKILKKISDPNHLSLLAEALVPLLLADPSFKVRIPNVAEIISDMKNEIVRLRHQQTGEAWKHIAFLIKGIVLLSADEIGINDKGEIVLTHHAGLPAQATMPERPVF